jgi:hypothetical protein
MLASPVLVVSSYALRCPFFPPCFVLVDCVPVDVRFLSCDACISAVHTYMCASVWRESAFAKKHPASCCVKQTSVQLQRHALCDCARRRSYAAHAASRYACAAAAGSSAWMMPRPTITTSAPRVIACDNFSPQMVHAIILIIKSCSSSSSSGQVRQCHHEHNAHHHAHAHTHNTHTLAHHHTNTHTTSGVV